MDILVSLIKRRIILKIGIDIGGSHIGIGQIDIDGKIFLKKEIDLRDIINNNIEDNITQYIINELETLTREYNIELIGLAMPGTVKDRELTRSINLGVKNFKIAEIIENKFNIPVIANNDAKCAAMAEKQFGSLKKYEDCIFLCLGTRIGGAAFLNNKI